MYNSHQELEHFGIKGMKWGVRRTPEQLGNKEVRPRLTSSDKWKSNELSKIDKLYSKAYKRLDKDLERGVDKKTVDAKRKELERSHKKDRKSITKMTYAEVEKERQKRSNKFTDDAADVIKTSALILGGAAWTTQLAGALYIAGGLNTLQQTISSPAIQDTVNTGYEFIRRFLK